MLFFFMSITFNIIQDKGFEMDDWSYDGITFLQIFRLNKVEIESVMFEIKNLKMSKPSGLENISTKIIHDILWTLAHKFTWLLNLLIRMAQVPLEWKKARISLIPKGGNLTDINKLRPFAILPVVSKIMEHPI